jgi:hypothetical protein
MTNERWTIRRHPAKAVRIFSIHEATLIFCGHFGSQSPQAVQADAQALSGMNWK